MINNYILKKDIRNYYDECKSRGYNVVYYGDVWNQISNDLMNDYTQTEEDEKIIRERIREKLNKGLV